MIKFTITSSPDSEVLGEHIYYKDLFVIGSSQSDLHIQDPQLRAPHGELFVENNEIFYRPRSLDKEIYLEGRKIEGSVRLQLKRPFRLGETSFEIIQIENEKQPLADNLKKRFQEIHQDHPDLDQLVLKVEEDISKIQQEQ